MAKKTRTGAGNEYKTTLGQGDTQSKLNSNEIHQNKTAKVSFEDDLLKYKPTRGVNKIIQGHITSSNGVTTARTVTQTVGEESPGREKGDGQILQRELLDSGQGKSLSNMDISADLEIGYPRFRALGRVRRIRAAICCCPSCPAP